MTVVGTLGEGKLVVLHPAFRGDMPGMDFAFGIQRTIARRLKACGRPTMFGVMRTSVERVELEGEGPPTLEVGQIQLAVADEWPDDEVDLRAATGAETQADRRTVALHAASVIDGRRRLERLQSAHAIGSDPHRCRA